MHELSIALGIIDIADEEAAPLGPGTIAAVHVKLGPLSGVVKEALVSAFDLAREGSSLARSSLVFEDVPITVFCPSCGSPRPVKSVYDLSCQLCGTPGTEVISGRELEVVAMEVES